MIREICRDETFLAQKAAPATADDLATAQDIRCIQAMMWASS